MSAPEESDKTIRASEPDPTPPEVQAKLADPSQRLGQYVLTIQLGAGGMGSVWKAWDTNLTRWVAVKLLNAFDEASIRRFRREAQMAGRLHHPNIAAVHEVGEFKGMHFLVMDLIEGACIGKTDLPFRTRLEAFEKVCRAIDYAHRNQVIHRDIKPSNIMVSKEGEPIVMDFGLAKIIHAESSISVPGTVLGTPAYMAPEQARGQIKEVDAQSDIFSLGATLYSLVTGHPPFEGENASAVMYKVMAEDPVPPRKLNGEVPEAVERVILKAMQKTKANRYATPGEMADDLHRHLSDQPVLASAPRVTARFVRRFRRSPGLFAGVAALLLAAGAFVVVLATRGKKETPGPPEKAAKPPSSIPARLDFASFAGASEDLTLEAKRIFSENPAPVPSWIREQTDRVPSAWPKSDWLEKKGEAKRIREWCATLTAAIEGLGADFDFVRTRLREIDGRFAPVAAYEGTISLKIVVWPYATIRALRAGSEWVVKEGAKVGGDALAVGEILATPLVIDRLDIADYTLVLAHPETGERTVTLPARGLRSGLTYYVLGSIDKPDSIRLSDSP